MNELLNSPQHRQVIECIESWHNEDYTQWYRVYSDNWCEQGGFIAATANDQQNVSVTFIKPYIHSPFIQGQNYILQTATNSWTFICYISGLGNISNTGFGCSIGRTGNSGQGLVWKAEGYIA